MIENKNNLVDIKPHLEGLAKDSEIFTELKQKLEKCDNLEFLAILKEQLSENKSKMSSIEIKELAEIYKKIDFKLNNNVNL